MVLFKFAKFCLLENFNKMDIIRTFTKITNYFHSETNRPSAYYEEALSFFVSIEMPAQVVFFYALVVFLISHLFNQVINNSAYITLCDWVVIYNEWLVICGLI